jgi:hypothetical protein
MRISFATHMPWATEEQPAPTYFREQILNQVTCGLHLPHPRHGLKKHTLRRMKGEKPRFRKGMELQLVEGPRYQAEQFATTKCTDVQVVRMRALWSSSEIGSGFSVHAEIGDRVLSRSELLTLAANDGFYHYSHFERWFLLDLLQNGDGAYELIHWTRTRY